MPENIEVPTEKVHDLIRAIETARKRAASPYTAPEEIDRNLGLIHALATSLLPSPKE